MSAVENKHLMETIFSELATGNDQPFLEAMADDMQWRWMGSGQWAKTFQGKQAVVNELWGSVKTTLRPPYKATARRIIAEGEYVVVEAIGDNMTPDGKLYNNRYCWVCRMGEGKLRAINEYMDTELVTMTFQS
ncbi:nuclear transport factor 2 family protein [Spirosoma endbachense]|uniref:Nuclear transport factor 2 family protein n=1 Tax=Spirosoma endbachense TaxID=2666025 RepID=A0A6P1VQY1_9BACT|nr:nuclear transport factor 2 family protein [Spirosoma endbachense]QHV95661.1 nuclear transport factor 2 family protein [Spirosoma endbachense]